MKCPKCSTETLSEFSVQTMAVNRCTSCEGIWFDDQELRLLLAEDRRQVAALRHGNFHEEAAGHKGFCPRDASALLRVYSAIDRSVILDACPQCRGIWLDGGEFEKLFAARHL
jgi:Zn-finger nucleic acid-binding protein